MKISYKNIAIMVLGIACIAMPAWYLYNKKRTKEATRAENIKNNIYTYEVSVCDSNQKGYLLMSPSRKSPIAIGHLIIMNMQGEIIAKREFDCEAHDFRQWNIDNKTYYTYAVNDNKAYHSKHLLYRVPTGPIVVLDSALNKIGEHHLISHGDIIANMHRDLDTHDVILLSANHLLTLTSYEKTVNNIPEKYHPAPHKQVQATIIQESIDGKVVWQWDATKFPELYLPSSNHPHQYSDTSTADYIHVNSLVLDPKDSNVIISSKELHQLIKINRKTGEIMWKLGGENSDFQLTEQQVFFGQHAVTFIDSNKTMLFVDNGNSKKRPYTRIIECQIDEKNKTITYFKAVRVPHLFTQGQGNVSKLQDGNYLFCGGVANYILIFDPITEKFKFEMQSNLSSYRAYYTNNICGLENKKRTN